MSKILKQHISTLQRWLDEGMYCEEEKIVTKFMMKKFGAEVPDEEIEPLKSLENYDLVNTALDHIVSIIEKKETPGIPKT
ncbi:MAG: hypothetical protein GY754_15095 [bacterium]|nr:hypothetical protein [bacterium]